VAISSINGQGPPSLLKGSMIHPKLEKINMLTEKRDGLLWELC